MENVVKRNKTWKLPLLCGKCMENITTCYNISNTQLTSPYYVSLFMREFGSRSYLTDKWFPLRSPSLFIFSFIFTIIGPDNSLLVFHFFCTNLHSHGPHHGQTWSEIHVWHVFSTKCVENFFCVKSLWGRLILGTKEVVWKKGFLTEIWWDFLLFWTCVPWRSVKLVWKYTPYLRESLSHQTTIFRAISAVRVGVKAGA